LEYAHCHLKPLEDLHNDKRELYEVVRLIRRKWQAKAKHDWLKAMKQNTKVYTGPPQVMSDVIRMLFS